MLTHRHGRLLDYLTEIATIGEPCPTLSALAVRFKAAQSTITQMLAELTEAGAIAQDVTRRGRIVTITASGRSTKGFDRPTLETPVPIPSVKTAEIATKKARIAMIRDAVAKKKAPTPDPDPIQEKLRAGTVVSAVSEPQPTAVEETPSVPIEVEPAPILSIAPAAIERPLAPAPLPHAIAPIVPGLAVDMDYTDGELRLTVWLSSDPTSPRMYQPFLTVPLDEAHTVELLGSTVIALQQSRAGRGVRR